MSEVDDTLNALREALAVTPDNPVLRSHLGNLLLKRNLFDEAEKVFREGLQSAPASEKLKLGLARCCHGLGKHSQALVIIEELIGQPDADPAVHLFHARLLLRRGDLDSAGTAYRKAIDADPGLADEELASVLDVKPARPSRSSFSDDEDDDDISFDEDDEDVDEHGRIRMRQGGRGPTESFAEMEKPDVSFRDVGGMEQLKQDIRMKIIAPLQNAELFASYGKKIGGGVLMYGPPGCGKTHLARATAGEVEAAFIAIGIHDVLDMYIGESERKLHALFEQARSHKPCVLFFDEVDALGASRSDLRQSAGRHLVNQFLAELDGVKDSNEGVLVLGATNAPWHLDSAFRRPGRFDRILFVPPPDEPARADILRIVARGKPMQDVDFTQIAKKTREFSGADLRAVIDMAVEAKLEEAMKTGVPAPLTTKDLLRAIKQVKPSTKQWFASAKNYAMYANEGGLYDDILTYLKMT